MFCHPSILQITLGIISPERITATLQPISNPRASINPGLFNVALRIKASPMYTGSSIATGVTLPVLAVCQTTSSRVVSTASERSFKAYAP